MTRSDPVLLQNKKKEVCFQQRTLEFARGNDLDIHNRLQDYWLRVSINFTESANRSESEGQFRGIDGMEGTIL